MTFNIKGFKPSKTSRYRQGYISINECKKFRGKGPIIYRSSWEQRFCQYCERNENIEWWSSESIVIRYMSPVDSRVHEYFPDFVLQLTTGQVIIAEIKPISQLKEPKKPRSKSPKTIQSYRQKYMDYMVNMAKIAAAKEYASRTGAKYLLVTEKFFLPS